MRIVVRDHDRNRREVYNIRTMRSNRANKPNVVKDSDDDKIKELEKRVDELEKEIKALSKETDEPSEDEPEVDEEDLDEVEPEEVEVEEDEKVEDLGDGCKVGDSARILPRKSLRSIGALTKTSTNDSINSDEAEINAWKNR